jgi:hypothetical protein
MVSRFKDLLHETSIEGRRVTGKSTVHVLNLSKGDLPLQIKRNEKKSSKLITWRTGAKP